MSTLLNRLFDFDRQETAGEMLFYRLFELLIMYWVVTFAWKWGLYIQRLGDVVLPLGIANYLDVSFMFSGGLSIWNARIHKRGRSWWDFSVCPVSDILQRLP